MVTPEMSTNSRNIFDTHQYSKGDESATERYNREDCQYYFEAVAVLEKFMAWRQTVQTAVSGLKL